MYLLLSDQIPYQPPVLWERFSEVGHGLGPVVHVVEEGERERHGQEAAKDPGPYPVAEHFGDLTGNLRTLSKQMLTYCM